MSFFQHFFPLVSQFTINSKQSSVINAIVTSERSIVSSDIFHTSKPLFNIRQSKYGPLDSLFLSPAEQKYIIIADDESENHRQVLDDIKSDFIGGLGQVAFIKVYNGTKAFYVYSHLIHEKGISNKNIAIITDNEMSMGEYDSTIIMSYYDKSLDCWKDTEKTSISDI